MKIGAWLRWYDRKDNFDPDYDKEHHCTVHGESPEEIMAQIRALKENQDLSKFTPVEIVSIF